MMVKTSVNESVCFINSDRSNLLLVPASVEYMYSTCTLLVPPVVPRCCHPSNVSGGPLFRARMFSFLGKTEDPLSPSHSRLLSHGGKPHAFYRLITKELMST